MSGFAFSVLASIVGTLVLLTLGTLWSQRLRWVIASFLSRITRGDFGEAWQSKRDATDDITREIARASHVDLFTGRGNELQRETFEALLAFRPTNSPVVFRILLPKTGDTSEGKWTSDRESELATFDASFVNGLLHRQVDTTAAAIEPHLVPDRVMLRRYNFPHIGRILITDRIAFFTPYSADKHGRDNPVLKYPSGSPMYGFLSRLYRKIWVSS